jgi:hypothetical protein
MSHGYIRVNVERTPANQAEVRPRRWWCSLSVGARRRNAPRQKQLADRCDRVAVHTHAATHPGTRTLGQRRPRCDHILVFGPHTRRILRLTAPIDPLVPDQHRSASLPRCPAAVLDNRGATTANTRAISGNIRTGRRPVTRGEHSYRIWYCNPHRPGILGFFVLWIVWFMTRLARRKHPRFPAGKSESGGFRPDRYCCVPRRYLPTMPRRTSCVPAPISKSLASR